MFELFVGATTSQQPDERMRKLQVLLKSVEIIPFRESEAEKAAIIKADLKSKGLGIGPLDTLIAGTAMAHHLTLVTNNIGEFSRVAGLTSIDWSKP